MKNHGYETSSKINHCIERQPLRMVKTGLGLNAEVLTNPNNSTKILIIEKTFSLPCLENSQ
mgnify:CR=1 FL=1